MSNIQATLDEREKTHGDYKSFCLIYTKLEAAATEHAVGTLTPSQTVSISMILYKIARILNGKADTIDHWKDIEGYAALITRELLGVRSCSGQ